jgi:hypothetical protein
MKMDFKKKSAEALLFDYWRSNLESMQSIFGETKINLKGLATFLRFNVDEEAPSFDLKNIVGVSTMFSAKWNYVSF